MHLSFFATFRSFLESLRFRTAPLAKMSLSLVSICSLRFLTVLGILFTVCLIKCRKFKELLIDLLKQIVPLRHLIELVANLDRATRLDEVLLVFADRCCFSSTKSLRCRPSPATRRTRSSWPRGRCWETSSSLENSESCKSSKTRSCTGADSRHYFLLFLTSFYVA